MSSSKLLALIAVSVSLLVTCVFITGCGNKKEATNSWVNTKSLPGHTFSNRGNNTKNTNPKIVYLGLTAPVKRDGFGPHDPSFDFEHLK